MIEANPRLFVIHKTNKEPSKAKGSYAGNVWDKAKARHKFKKHYTNRQEALLIAFYLNQFSHFDLAVSEV